MANFRRNPTGLLYAALLVVMAVMVVPANGVETADTTGEARIRRFDPHSRSLVAVEPDQVKPGKIYNHYSERHGRYVWALANEGGGFAYTLGPGTTELPENFDLAAPPQQMEQLLQEEVGDWYEASRSMGSRVMVRLDDDGRWSLLRHPTIRTHFDLDTRRRWEWHGRRRVPVAHTNGYGWRYHDGRYLPDMPANPWSDVACSYCSHNAVCATCGVAR